MVKIYEWTCPECEKEIKSIWKNQFKYNKEQHIEFHKRRKKEEKVAAVH